MEIKQNKDVSRRRFLQKTAVGAVIASLPAKSVWGACSVSGALSGNLSQNTDRHDCTIPKLWNGRSPGGWLNYKSNCHSIFTDLSRKKVIYKKKPQIYQKYLKCYVDAVELAMDMPLILPAELEAASHSVRSGLASNGYGDSNIYFHLAAVYLNAFFGLYPGYSGQADAEALVERLYLFWYTQKSTSSFSTISDHMLGYTDGSTRWVANCSI
ncbi:hypothetical protein [Rheinheimera sp.]|uniref:hypothetical protein n=1 Tax=Rheinheimera sp. TaxID=1869214 RepID=UPI0027364DC4|nr:hypothetical protein [Rheinheimera sp.]MDP2716254.1 hypothetical protein [Rheinheimera sp.]